MRRGSLSLPSHLDILEWAEDGSKGGGVLWVGFQGLQGGDEGVPSFPHHLQCGGGCGDETLGRGYGGKRGQAEQAQTREQEPKPLF